MKTISAFLRNIPSSCLFHIGVSVAWLASSMTAQAGKVSISLTAVEEGGSSDARDVTSVEAPKMVVINTGTILNQLALDEKAAGVYTNSSFPQGAVLAYPGFFCVTFYGQTIDVSNILGLQWGTNAPYWGKFQDSSSIWNYSARQIVTLTYDSTSIGGKSKFSVSGLGLIKDVAFQPDQVFPSSGPSFYETMSLTAQVAGEGLDARGTNMVVSGSIIVSGRWEHSPQIGQTPPNGTNGPQRQ